MLEQLLNHIDRHNLCKTTDKILLAVSGGVDSMVMVDLFSKTDFKFGVAHCNFQLRDQDSDDDEQFVSDFCAARSIPFHSVKFDMKSAAEQRGESIQLAARRLRYGFFEETRLAYNYDVIATAHHFNDSIETSLLNFIRGSGLTGLAGIPVKVNEIIRPLMFASRSEIQQYAKAYNIAWREDRSNSEDDYNRNYLRHHVMPLIEQLNPNFIDTSRNTLLRLAGAVETNARWLQEFESKFVVMSDDGITIQQAGFTALKYPEVVLWELLKDKGFTFQQCRDIIETNHSGKEFFTTSHRLLVDRGRYIIGNRKLEIIPEMLITEDQSLVNNGRETLAIEKVASFDIRSIDRSISIAYLDAAKLTFPLRWRNWRKGDAFKALGMKSSKKISDLLIDLKLPMVKKETVTVLESDGKIAWVVGIRISDDFKITEKTATAYKLKVNKTAP